MANSDTQKRERARRTREFLDELCTLYPTCFTRDAAAIRPLAIGIQKPLREQLAAHETLSDTPGWLIRQALALYTRSPAYLEATIARRTRINLDGTDAGDISDEAVAFARTRREEQKKRRAERQRRDGRNARRGKPAQPSPEEIRERKLAALAAKFNNN